MMNSAADWTAGSPIPLGGLGANPVRAHGPGEDCVDELGGGGAVVLRDPPLRIDLERDVPSLRVDEVAAALLMLYLRGVVVRGTLAIMRERLLVLLGLL
jgi:hypothetical protein